MTGGIGWTEQKKVWDRIWSGGVSYKWDPLSQTVYEQLRRSFGDIEGKRIVEAGSGTGKISLRLAQEGALVTLIDYSDLALANSREAFYEQEAAATFLLADIRSSGLQSGSYDLVWNAGVLEHFELDEQVNILKEMARITKPGGIVLVMTPNAHCLPYRVGKAHAESMGTWMYGAEHPVDSLLAAFELSGITAIEETHTGFVDSLAFLDFIAGTSAVKEALRLWYEALAPSEQPNFPGYLRVTIGTVESKQEQAAPADLVESGANAASFNEAAEDADEYGSFGPNIEISSADNEITATLNELSGIGLSPTLIHSMKRLIQVQQLLTDYHSDNGNPHYLTAYRDAEASYWLPLLPTLDRLLQRGQAGDGPAADKPKVLDVGAAYGTLLLYSSLSGADCYGVDMTDRYWPPRLSDDYGIKWASCNIEAEEIPGSQPFDVILFTEVLEHMNYNPIPVFEKFRARLREGGSLLLSTPWKRHFAPNHPSPDLFQLPYYEPGNSFIDAEIKYYSIDELYALAETTFFDVQSIQVFNGHLLGWFVKR
ncbi:class I SAM-dependent methyltransferase [Paenibacillus sp. 2TAB19]|uniref:class I SAM-dependent methyltransferase n=1 Tax=Paenibacillus sp. 2TAB19 TaxID=3233003 RepID=UPI003F9BCF4C